MPQGLMFQAFSLWVLREISFFEALPQGLMFQAFSLRGGKEPERLRHHNLRHSLNQPEGLKGLK